MGYHSWLLHKRKTRNGNRYEMAGTSAIAHKFDVMSRELHFMIYY